jgi:hypothetical protein
MASVRFAPLAFALLLTSCSLLLSVADPEQCTTDADCEANPLFRGRVCRSGICAPKPQGQTQIVSTTNDASADAGGCQSTDECKASPNSTSICRTKGMPCVPITSTECTDVTDGWDDPAALFIGFIGPSTFAEVTGNRPISLSVTVQRQSVVMALREVADHLEGGVLPRSGRRLVIVTCDSEANPDKAKAAMAHLTSNVGVAAVIAVNDTDVNAIIERARDEEVAVVCTDCASPPPTGEPAFVWRTRPPIAYQARLAAQLVDALARPREPAKIVLLSQEGYPPSDSFVTELGKLLPSSAGEREVFPVQAPEPRLHVVDHEGLAKRILDIQPDVIVAADSLDLQTYYIPMVEKGWPRDGGSKPRPYWVDTDITLSAGSYGKAIADALQGDDLRRRILGVHAFDPALDAAMTGYAKRYRLRYTQGPGSRLPDYFGQSAYEAFYSLFYALIDVNAENNPAFDGKSVALAFSHLRGGTPVDIGPDAVSGAVKALDARQTINLEGLWSRLDWDTTTRVVTGTPVQTHCLNVSPDGGITVDLVAGPTCPADPNAPCSNAHTDAGFFDIRCW